MDPVEANIILHEIKQLKDDIEDIEAVNEATVQKFYEITDTKIARLQTELNFKKSQLRAFLVEREDELKHSKTQAKYDKLPCGTLVIKKPAMKIIKEDETLLEWAKTNATEYIKKSVQTKLDWANFKKNLIVNDFGEVVNKETGEIVNIPGIAVTEEGEEFEVKF